MSKFKVGDRVRVKDIPVGTTEKLGVGAVFSFTFEMSLLSGSVGLVTHVYPNGVVRALFSDGRSEAWYFSDSWLERSYASDLDSSELGSRNLLSVRDLREALRGIPDDFCISVRVRRKLSDTELEGLRHPYPYLSEDSVLEFDDVVRSDGVLYLGVEYDLKG